MTRRDVVRLLQDLFLAAALCAMSIAEIWVPLNSVQGEGSSVLATVVSVSTCAVLAIRRLRPLTTVLIIVVGWPIIFSLLTLPVLFWGQLVPLLIAVYSVARHGQGRHGIYGGAATAALLLFFTFRVDVLATVEDIIFNWLTLSTAWLAGWGLRRFEERALAATKRAAEAEMASRERTLAAIAQERARIARELHDIVAHAVSVMVVQAGAAEQVVDDDPVFTRSALGSIRSTGTGALAEMRRVVAMVREPDDVSALEPQPGIARLPALVDEARAAGLETTLRIEGAARALPVGLDLTVYRIVQEALTNVRRHAGASAAEVLVKLSGGVEVSISDNGTGAADDRRLGHGLIGMRERALLYGGQFETSSRPGAGFTVRVILPTAAGS